MLSQLYPLETLESILIPRTSWHPFPTADERDAWGALPASVRQAHIARGEATLDHEWPPVPAIRFLDFARDGNRSRYERLSMGRRSTLSGLVIAECMEGKGRFLDDITNGIWLICEESFWGVPAHISAQKAGKGLPDVTEPIVDLFAAETSALLAWTAYLLGPQLDTVSPLIQPRIEYEIDRRILTPLFEREDFGWMGFRGQRVNNWNPWICSNWLASTLLSEKNGQRRLQSVAKAMRTVDHFVDPYPKDGGCDEGPGYWGRAGASLYDCLEWLYSATDGKIDVYGNPLVQNIGKFIYRVQIHDRYFINFADAAAMLTPSAGVVHGYGKRINDPQMMALGAWSAKQQDVENCGVGDSLGRQLPTLFALDELLSTDPTPPLPRDVWMDEIEVMVARDAAGTSDGLFLAVKGGHNAESHNHNDVGNVVVYADGRPVLIDAGVETYSAKTFSSKRYEIWTMQSAYHSLPSINGVQQSPGQQYAARNVACEADDQHAQISLDIAPAYPESAGVRSWQRTVALERGKAIRLTDTWDLEAVTGELTLNLLTPCKVVLQSEGVIALQPSPLSDGRMSGDMLLHHDASLLTPTIEEFPVEDSRLNGIWGERLTRIVLRAKSPTKQGSWMVRVTNLDA